MSGRFIVPPGAPGISPRWTSSAKSGVGTAANSDSRVWFTISHGILNEIYAPRLDMACIRDFGFIVTSGGYFSEEKRDTIQTGEMLDDGVPAYRLVHTARDGRYRITKTIFSDPDREVVLQEVGFEALIGNMSDYALHALVAPHLVNAGSGNTVWYGDFKGHGMLFGEGRGTFMAVASSVPWLARSAGFVGVSDGWQSLRRGEGLRPEYQRAENGNVAISGTLDLNAGNGRALIAIAFGAQAEEAAFRALISLQRGTEPVLEEFRIGWRQWQSGLLPLDLPATEGGPNRYRVSTMVLASHRDASSGAIIASLSIPWGSSKGDDDLGGYHLVWPRDLVEIAGGLLAAGSSGAAKGVLRYLMAVQEADGHWVQNSWLDGRPYWGGIQMDETGFPILLYDMLVRAGAVGPEEAPRYARMIEAAAGYIVRNGPSTPQDRWEEDGGYSPFTLAVQIAALLAAADAIEAGGRSAAAQYLREVADGWNEQIETWTYAVDTELSRRLGIEGYYVRIGDSTGGGKDALRGRVAIRNRADTNASLEANSLISPDALALVRFGLRAADDPRIRNTVLAIDAVLKRDLPAGPYWYRYNDDGYGEHEDGAPFDGTGIGRLWPLLTGERAHYELALGNVEEVRRLLAAMEASSSEGGLIPEQIWDSKDLPERELFLGRPAGSAMPLAWAHAEHVKLLRSLRDGAVFDMPRQTSERYIRNKAKARVWSWRMNAKGDMVTEGRILRLEVLEPALVRWSSNNWRTFEDAKVEASGFGTYVYDLQTRGLGEKIVFTFYWTDRGSWEGRNFEVRIKNVSASR